MLNAFLVRAMSTWLAGFVLRLHLYGAGAVAQPVPQERRPRRVLSVSAPDPAVARQPRGRPRARGTAGLTPRQLEVVLLLRDGLQQSQIAEALSISRRQVERHVSDARARTGARTSAELVARVVRDGLVPAPATAAPEPA